MAIKIPKIWLIVLIALLLRSWQIAKLPSLNPDEAALGYNAYSLLKTGRDEHGISWPTHFKSFGDYKPGGYVYLAMPFVKTFGLTPLAVRLPNLILSVLTVFVLYKLVFLLTNNSKVSNLVSFVLAINPWHLQFSRGAWESSAALFFMLLGTYWFYSFIIKKKPIYIYIFSIPLVFALATYHSARIVAPLLFLVFLIMYFKKLMNRHFFLALILGLILVAPVSYSFLRDGGFARFGSVGLTADTGPLSRSEELLNNHGNVKLINRIMHNRRVLYTLSWVEKYTSHFNLNFLFLDGDEVPRSKNPDMGQLYLLELPFLILGIVKLFQSKNNHLKILTLSILFISPLASSLTFQAPSALRALPLVISLSILIGLGLSTLNNKILVILISFIYLVSGIYYLDSYYLHAPKRYPFAWNTGFPQAVEYLESQKNNFENIYFTNKYDQPYILYLFFSQYPPENIQTQIQLTPNDKFGFSTVATIDNIHFGKIIWDEIPQGSLVFAVDETISQTPINSIDFPNNTKGFKIYVK